MPGCEWIPVDERLPEWGETIIVAHRRYEWSNSRHKYVNLKRLGVRPATYWYEDDNGPRFCYGDGNVVKEPTHWIKLPEPPKVTQ